MDSIISDSHKWTREDVANLLMSGTALTDLDLVSARIIAKAMKSTRYKAGAVLMQEGLPSSGFMMLILRGEVVVEYQSARRVDSVVLGVAGPGSILGEMSLLDGEPRSATCTATSDLDVALLDRPGLAALMNKEPLAVAKLLAVLLARSSKRLRSSNRKLRAMNQLNISLREELGTSLHSKLQSDPMPFSRGETTGMVLL